MLTKLCHKNIIKLNEIIDAEKAKNVYLVMNLCQGGTLLEKLNKSENGLDEALVK